MPTPTYTPLANITLGSSASSVTFSSITGSYRDLVLVANVRSTRADTVDYLALRLNGDSGTNYSFVAAWADNNNSVQPGTNSGTNYLQGFDVAAANNTANIFTQVIYNFMDYSATDKHKTNLARQSGVDVAGAQVTMLASRWASTSAITSIVLSLPYTGPSSFVAGSTFALYGIAS